MSGRRIGDRWPLPCPACGSPDDVTAVHWKESAPLDHEAETGELGVVLRCGRCQVNVDLYLPQGRTAEAVWDITP